MDINTLLSLLGGFLLLLLLLYFLKKRHKASMDKLSVKQFLENADSWGKDNHSACASCAAKGACSTHSQPSPKKKKEQPIYYDDEELDLFTGRDPHSYSPEEIEAFKEVYTTLLVEDRKGWLNSLQMRGILLPFSLQKEMEETLKRM